MRGSQENVYYQIEPIISAYEIHEDILLETVFRLWLMHNQFHDLPRAAPFFERDKWGILYEGEAFMEWKKQFYVSPDVSLAETYAASMSKQELQNYRRIVRATALAAMGRDFIDEVPDIFRHSYFLEQDKIEKSKPVHQPKR